VKLFIYLANFSAVRFAAEVGCQLLVVTVGLVTFQGTHLQFWQALCVPLRTIVDHRVQMAVMITPQDVSSNHILSALINFSFVQQLCKFQKVQKHQLWGAVWVTSSTTALQEHLK